MQHIKKGPEPKEWLRFRKQNLPEPRFDDGPKASVRTALLAEQGHICCYCMRRIYDRPGATKIEHWAPQSLSPELALDYRNLFASCDGGEGGGAAEHHCDTAKGSTPISLDPRRADCSRLLAYASRGEVVAVEGDDTPVSVDIEVLKLNLRRLRAARIGAIEAIQRWADSKSGTRTRHQIQEQLARIETPDADGKLEAFLGVKVAWLEKHLRGRPK